MGVVDLCVQLAMTRMSCAYFAWSNLSVFAAARSAPLGGTLVNSLDYGEGAVVDCLEDEN